MTLGSASVGKEVIIYTVCTHVWLSGGTVRGGARSQAADVGEALELLGEVVLVEDRVGPVLHHLQRHGGKHRRKLVDALGPGERDGAKPTVWINVCPSNA